jgi:hypothetical protein
MIFSLLELDRSTTQILDAHNLDAQLQDGVTWSSFNRKSVGA